jgi:hypothetical protein
MTRDTLREPTVDVVASMQSLPDSTRLVAVATVYSPESRRVYMVRRAIESQEDAVNVLPIRRALEADTIELLRRLGAHDLRIAVEQAAEFPSLVRLTTYVAGRLPGA